MCADPSWRDWVGAILHQCGRAQTLAVKWRARPAWLAVVLVLAGFLTGISGVVTFLRAKTTVDPTKPRASSLVTWGVYAISRNPMYLGGLTMLLAQSRRGVGRCPCDHRPGHTGSVAIWRTSSPLRDDVRSIRFSACQSSRPLPASGSV
jgi:protein-S-isoprenylcysteine O-methyltransferase Ste14